ncbi:MAG TPA: ATP-binding protein [Anaerolineae bacterium]|nr:ATP-binding protein [Anaerolineae bacterium]
MTNFLQRLQLTRLRTKIILPYFLLTTMVAGFGAFVITQLVTGTLKERFDNQLLDAGRVVAESMVAIERDRLELVRLAAASAGVPAAIANQDTTTLTTLLPQLLANSEADALIILDNEGQPLYNGTNNNTLSLDNIDFTALPPVQTFIDTPPTNNNRQVAVAQTETDNWFFTIAPIFATTEFVGFVLVGTELENLSQILAENAVARVTLYSPQGNPLASTLDLDQLNTDIDFADVYPQVLTASSQYVLMDTVTSLNQEYQLAFNNWQLRGQSVGMYSVALPINFIGTATNASRNSFIIIFALTTIGVFTIGYWTAQLITRPIRRLVNTATAVAEGDLQQRVNIENKDEIGTLAQAFNRMTETLVERNQQLSVQKSELQAILQSIADGIIMFNNRKEIVTTNPAADQILADIKQKLKTSAIIDVVQLWIDQLNLHATTRQKVGHRVFSVRPSAVTDPNQEIIGHVVVLRDITRDVEAEERQNNFITNVSHELRTPLTAVKGYTNLLIASGKETLSEQHLQFAHTIEQNTDKLIDHVNTLIDIAEVQDGNITLKPERIDFNQLIQDVAQPWLQKFTDKGLQFSLDPAPEPLWVQADARRIKWALKNILQNAYDYTLTGQISIKIFLQDGHACATIKDTGIGIHATDVPYVFQRFFRAEHDQTHDVPGLGLDLFISKALITAHDGQIWVESELDHGSTFGLALPLITED